MKTGVIVLSAVGVVIIVAAVLTPLKFFSPHYSLVWAVACFIAAGVLGRQLTKSK
jgi:hypothetical protein